MRDYERFLEVHQFVLTPDVLSDICNQLDFLSVEQQVRLYNFLIEYFNLEEADSE